MRGGIADEAIYGLLDCFALLAMTTCVRLYLMDFQNFSFTCEKAGVDLVTGVPDGYLVPLIESVSGSDIPYVAAAREEECLAIASGAAMGGKRALVMIQNSGFLNSIGCFATLCVNYKVPMVILVAHRGNVFDANGYDTEKYRAYEAFIKSANMFHVSVYEKRDEADLLEKAFARAEVSGEPTFLNLDFNPQSGAAAC